MFELPPQSSHERTIIEPSKPFSYTGDLHLSDALDDPGQRSQFMRQPTSGGSENWQLQDVTLFPGLGLVFKAEQVIESTRFCVFQGEEEMARQRIARAHPSLQAGRFFQGLNRCSGNYFHLLTQVIPAIASYAACPGFREGTLLIQSPGPTFFRGVGLAGIGLPKIQIVDPMIPLDVSDLTFSSYLSRPNLISIFSRSIYDRMIARVSLDALKIPPRRMLYVWRVDTPTRVMRNEDELVERLIQRFDVEPVVLSTFTLDEQIALFQSARVVIGPHGAGLANVVFCRPDTVLYELIPHHYINAAPNQLAQLRGVHYWCDIHRAEPRPGLWRHQTPWTVDIEAVERRFEEILRRYGI